MSSELDKNNHKPGRGFVVSWTMSQDFNEFMEDFFHDEDDSDLEKLANVSSHDRYHGKGRVYMDRLEPGLRRATKGSTKES